MTQTLSHVVYKFLLRKRCRQGSTVTTGEVTNHDTNTKEIKFPRKPPNTKGNESPPETTSNLEVPRCWGSLDDQKTRTVSVSSNIPYKHPPKHYGTEFLPPRDPSCYCGSNLINLNNTPCLTSNRTVYNMQVNFCYTTRQKTHRVRYWKLI